MIKFKLDRGIFAVWKSPYRLIWYHDFADKLCRVYLRIGNLIFTWEKVNGL